MTVPEVDSNVANLVVQHRYIDWHIGDTIFGVDEFGETGSAAFGPQLYGSFAVGPESDLVSS